MPQERNASPVVLVVDDEELLRYVATEIFEDAGFEVVEAANGREALDALNERPEIEAVFTDVHMPGAPNGIDLARHVRAVRPHCAVVVVSGRGEPGVSQLGNDIRFVPKPYRAEAVVRLVREMLAA